MTTVDEAREALLAWLPARYAALDAFEAAIRAEEAERWLNGDNRYTRGYADAEAKLAALREHRRLTKDDVDPRRYRGWYHDDWHCACGAFGNLLSDGYALHLEGAIRAALAATPAEEER